MSSTSSAPSLQSQHNVRGSEESCKPSQQKSTEPACSSCSSCSSSSSNKPDLITEKQIARAFPSLPLKERPFDIVIVLFYLTFIVSTAFFDYHNVLAPALGVSVRDLIDKDIDRPLNWPPAQFTKTAFRIWGEYIDPVMITNPLFWEIMEWINNIFMTPANIMMAMAFAFGWRSFKSLGIVHATAVLYSLFICIGVGMYGGEGIESVNKFHFLVAYSPYLSFPIIVIARLWHNTPNVFSKEHIAKKNWVEKGLAMMWACHIFFFVTFCYHWLLINTPYVLPDFPKFPIVGDYLMELSKLEGLH